MAPGGHVIGSLVYRLVGDATPVQDSIIQVEKALTQLRSERAAVGVQWDDASLNQALATLDKLKKSMGEAGQEAVAAGEQLEEGGRGATSLGGAAEGAGAAMRELAGIAAAVAAAVAAIRFTGAAVEAEQLDVSLGALARSTGESRGELDRQADSMAALGMGVGDAQRILSRMLSTQVDTQRALALTALAQDASAISMRNVSEEATALAEAIAYGNERMLRASGLAVDFAMAEAKKAAELGKSREALTQAELAMARFDAVLAEHPRVAGAASDAMETAGWQIRQMKVQLGEAVESIGMGFLPEMRRAAEGTRDLAIMLQQVPEPVRRAAANLVELGIGAVGVAGILRAVTMAGKLLGPTLIATGVSAGSIVAPVAAAAAGLTAYYAIAGKLKERNKELAEGAMRNAAEQRELAGRLEELEDAFEAGGASGAEFQDVLRGIRTVAPEMASELERAGVSVKSFKEALDDAKKAATTSELERYDEALAYMGKTAVAANEDLEAARKKIREVEYAIRQETAAHGARSLQVAQLRNDLKLAIADEAELAAAVKTSEQGIVSTEAAIYKLTGAVRDLPEGLTQAQQASIAVAVEQRLLADALQGTESAVASAASALEKYAKIAEDQVKAVQAAANAERAAAEENAARRRAEVTERVEGAKQAAEALAGVELVTARERLLQQAEVQKALAYGEETLTDERIRHIERFQGVNAAAQLARVQADASTAQQLKQIEADLAAEKDRIAQSEAQAIQKTLLEQLGSVQRQLQNEITARQGVAAAIETADAASKETLKATLLKYDQAIAAHYSTIMDLEGKVQAVAVKAAQDTAARKLSIASDTNAKLVALEQQRAEAMRAFTEASAAVEQRRQTEQESASSRRIQLETELSNQRIAKLEAEKTGHTAFDRMKDAAIARERQNLAGIIAQEERRKKIAQEGAAAEKEKAQTLAASNEKFRTFEQATQAMKKAQAALDADQLSIAEDEVAAAQELLGTYQEAIASRAKLEKSAEAEAEALEKGRESYERMDRTLQDLVTQLGEKKAAQLDTEDSAESEEEIRTRLLELHQGTEASLANAGISMTTIAEQTKATVDSMDAAADQAERLKAALEAASRIKVQPSGGGSAPASASAPSTAPEPAPTPPAAPAEPSLRAPAVVVPAVAGGAPAQPMGDVERAVAARLAGGPAITREEMFRLPPPIEAALAQAMSSAAAIAAMAARAPERPWVGAPGGAASTTVTYSAEIVLGLPSGKKVPTWTTREIYEAIREELEREGRMLGRS